MKRHERKAIEQIRENTERLLLAIRDGRATGELPDDLANGVGWMMLGLWQRDGSKAVHWDVDCDCGVLRLEANGYPEYEVPLNQVRTAEGVLRWLDHLCGKTWVTLDVLREFIVKSVELHNQPTHTRT